MIVSGLRNLRCRRITFVFYFVISTLSVPSRILKDDSTLKFMGTTIGIGILVTAFALPLLWGVCWLNQKFQLGQKSVFYPVILIAIVGAFRGAFLQSVISATGLDDDLNQTVAILSSIIFTLFYFITLSSFMEFILSRRERFNKIFQQATSLATVSMDITSEKNSEEIYNQTLSQMKTAISSHGLSVENSSSASLLATSQEIQTQINQVLRPLSHRLWVNAMGQVKHKNVWIIARDVMSDLDFNPKYLLCYQFFIGGYGIALVIGFQAALYVSSVATLTSALLIWLYFWLRPKMLRHLFTLGLVFLLAEGLLPVILSVLLRTPLNASASIIAGLLISPTLPGFIFIVSTFSLINLDRDIAISAATSVEYRLQSKIDSEKKKGEDVRLAEFLHNSLQSELFGITKHLEMISKDPYHQVTSELMNTLNSALDRKYDQLGEDALDGRSRILALVESWKGITQIDLIGLNYLAYDSQLAFQVSQIVEELVTNSIRYGQANQISIDFSKSLGLINIQLTHNGTKVVKNKEGLGSLLMRKYSENGLTVLPDKDRTGFSLSISTIG